jgi:hypothetical protein
MTKQRALTLGGILAGVFFIAVAIMYWTVAPKSLPLPNFLGHESGVSAVHVKHGVAAFLVGLACFVFAWFQSGPKREGAAHPDVQA